MYAGYTTRTDTERYELETHTHASTLRRTDYRRRSGGHFARPGAPPTHTGRRRDISRTRLPVPNTAPAISVELVRSHESGEVRAPRDREVRLNMRVCLVSLHRYMSGEREQILVISFSVISACFKREYQVVVKGSAAEGM